MYKNKVYNTLDSKIDNVLIFIVITMSMAFMYVVGWSCVQIGKEFQKGLQEATIKVDDK